MYKKIVANLVVFLALVLVMYTVYNVNHENKSNVSTIELGARKNKSPESYRKMLLDLYKTQPLNEEGINEHRQLKDVVIEEYDAKIDTMLSQLNDGKLKEDIQLLAESDRPLVELNQDIKNLKWTMANTDDYIPGLLIRIHKIDHKLEANGLTRSYRDLSNFYQNWGKEIQEKATLVPNKIYADPDLGKFLQANAQSAKLNDQLLSTQFASLTFDDGPNPITTPQILDILKAHDVKATFFVLGQNAEKYPEIIKRIHDEGHLVGNHSYSHRNFTLISEADILDELNHTNQIIENVTKTPVNYYRMPYGAGGQREMQLTKMTPVLWNVDSEDWKSRNEQVIINQILTTLRPNPVILMHDIYQESVNSLAAVIESVQTDGYQFVRLDELM